MTQIIKTIEEDNAYLLNHINSLYRQMGEFTVTGLAECSPLYQGEIEKLIAKLAERGVQVMLVNGVYVVADCSTPTKPAKRTRKTKDEQKAEKLASLVVLGRATFKATGAVLFGVQSGDKVYHLTMIDGKIRSCLNAATGECCKSRQYSGHCCHEERVMQYEVKRQSELAAPVAENELAGLPVVIRDGEGTHAYVLYARRCKCILVSEIAEIGAYRDGTEQDIERLHVMLRASYRDAYHGDFASAA